MTGFRDRAVGVWADSPWRMPWAAWKQVLGRTWSQASKDNISLAAAGVAFYGFTAMVPLLGAIVLSYGLIAEPASVIEDMRRLMAVMPADAAKLVAEQLMNIVKTSGDKKGFGLLLALLIALYGVRSGVASVITGLNIAYEEEERRGFVRLTMLTIAVTLGSVAIAIVAITAVAALGHLEDLAPNLPKAVAVVGKFASYLLLVLAGAAGAATLYRYGPDRVKARWIWITPGSLLAAGVWLLLSILFGIYVADFGSYNATYGSLGAVIIFLTWLYLSSYVLLIGAELNAEMERQTHVDTTVGPPMPEGKRGAAVADQTVTSPTPDTINASQAVQQPSTAAFLVTAIASSRVNHWTGSPKAGLVSTLLVTKGISALRQTGRARIGIALLSAGGLLAFLGRKPFLRSTK